MSQCSGDFRFISSEQTRCGGGWGKWKCMKGNLLGLHCVSHRPLSHLAATQSFSHSNLMPVHSGPWHTFSLSPRGYSTYETNDFYMSFCLSCLKVRMCRTPKPLLSPKTYRKTFSFWSCYFGDSLIQTGGGHVEILTFTPAQNAKNFPMSGA